MDKWKRKKEWGKINFYADFVKWRRDLNDEDLNMIEVDEENIKDEVCNEDY